MIFHSKQMYLTDKEVAWFQQPLYCLAVRNHRTPKCPLNLLAACNVYQGMDE